MPLDTEDVSELPGTGSPYLPLWREVRQYTRSARSEVQAAKDALLNAVGQDTDWQPQNLAGAGEMFSMRLSRAAGGQFIWDHAWEVVANAGFLGGLENWVITFLTADHAESEPFLAGARRACRKVHQLIQAQRARPPA